MRFGRSILPRVVPGLLLVAASGLVAPLPAQNQETLAVLPFENGGSYGRTPEEFEALRRGLAAMLQSELARNPALTLIDREATRRALAQQGSAVAERIDRETAVKVGREIGARYLVVGSFIDLYGDFRLDARLINVESGEIVKVVHNDPALHDRRDLMRMLESVAELLLRDPHLPQGAPGITRVSRPIPAEAVGFFSRGLFYQDGGDKAKALEYYQKALTLYPGFTEASNGIKAIAPSRRPQAV